MYCYPFGGGKDQDTFLHAFRNIETQSWIVTLGVGGFFRGIYEEL